MNRPDEVKVGLRRHSGSHCCESARPTLTRNRPPLTSSAPDNASPTRHSGPTLVRKVEELVRDASSRRFSERAVQALGHTGSMASLLIVTGPPGAGKSTVSGLLAARLSPSVLVEGDRFFAFLAEGAIEPWLPESQLQNGVVTEAAASATGRFAEDYDTIYDGVVGPWLLSTFVSVTGLVELDYVILLPPVDVCVARVRGRTGHGFSDEAATRRMHAEFDGASIDRRHVLAWGSAGPEETVNDIERARTEGLLRLVAGA